MPTYKYEAAYASGEKVSGVIEAMSQPDAVAQIRQSCEIVLSLREVPRVAPAKPAEKISKISSKALALTCQQFAIILKAGLPLVQTVDLVAEQCSEKSLKRLLEQISADVNDGWAMSRSIEQRSGGKLPVTFQETIRAGEESGDLVASFERLSEYFDRMAKTRSSVVGALIYPAFLGVVAVVVIGIIMVFAVPVFTNMFESMSIELPFPTRALIAMSNFMQKYILVIIGLIALIALGIRAYGHTEKGGMTLAKFQLNLPILGDVVRMSGASQFAHTMSTLLASGMPILHAIEVAGRTVDNRVMAAEITDTLPGVESGKSFGECLSYAKELPRMLVQMTAVGEATGSMETTLKILAEYYDNETDLRSKRALALLEPAIIVFMAFFVVLILLAVYLPLFSMYEGIY